MTNLRLTSTLIALVLTSSGVNIGASQAHITNASTSSTSSTTSTTMTTVSTDVSQSNEATKNKKQQRGCLSALYAWGLSWVTTPQPEPTTADKETKIIASYKNSTGRNKQLTALLYDLLPTMPLDLIKIMVDYDYLFEGERVEAIPVPAGTVNHLAVFPDGKVAASCLNKGNRHRKTVAYIIIWQPTVSNQQRTWKVLYTFEIKDRTTALAVLGPEKLVVGFTGELAIYTKNGTLLQTISSNINCLAVLPNNRLASGSHSKKIKIWNLTTGKCERELTGHNGKIRSLLALPGNLLASGDTTIKIWDLTEQAGYECIGTLISHHSGYINISGIRFKLHDRNINTLIALPNNRIASGSGDQTIRVWNLDTRQCERILAGGHMGSIKSLALLPDGAIASDAFDGTINIWYTPKQPGHECFLRLTSYNRSLHPLAALPDGRLLSGSTNKTILVWA